ncbi:hypothetical protein NGF19_24355 [Streptomyces sp. RY43-2]|uniref:Uncharacterized protein n=1 Tax=Streptomyces macrolidinus TaxID=2952607 RepID=A0ABT0ZJX0_9ACTN|nr:hypothetical protein [Streptomyces macrolidinus]MCN9243875.1 hypothetical protein [Streptomyces macrolidinus]
MSTPETSRYVRIRTELVVKVDDAGAVTKAALCRIAEDPDMPEGERAYTEGAVADDAAEALAYLVDPSDLLGDLPGVELAQASWSSESIDYDPDSPDWALDAEDEADDAEEGEVVRLG